jgi:two-component system response regulator FlrC
VNGATQRVLVIDDDIDVRDSIKRILDRAGFSVRTMADAAEVMLELARAPVDVIITDIIMPHLNGVDAIEHVRRVFPSIRIVAISGGGNFDVASSSPAPITTTSHLAAAHRAGAHVILAKPFEARELIQAVAIAVSGPGR